jgi:hypothetical protein
MSSSGWVKSHVADAGTNPARLRLSRAYVHSLSAQRSLAKKFMFHWV